jgi:predicted  nucleic acid-binding Zn-ribbon protein
MTPEQSQKFAQFQQEILPLRQQMMQLKTELMTLRTQQNPDWKAIADKQKQMVDVRTEIQKKRAAAGLPAVGGCGGGGCGMGMRGMGMCGMGM